MATDRVGLSGGDFEDPSLLEVIAITREDAVAAAAGGADRLEVVSSIDLGGLTPALEQFQRIRDAVDLPLRVMLRTNGGFGVSPSELASLEEQIAGLREAGADQFVLGFLDGDGALDLAAMEIVRSAIEPCPWTLHHAFDHAEDPVAAWEAARRLPNLDGVLSGGVRGDLRHGLQTLCARIGWQSGDLRWLAGGGLILDYIRPLGNAGIRMFHIGRAARFDHSWQRPVSVDAVRLWRQSLDAIG
ncbi:copper homeostasis protein CutC [soil metagenome]